MPSNLGYLLIVTYAHRYMWLYHISNFTKYLLHQDWGAKTLCGFWGTHGVGSVVHWLFPKIESLKNIYWDLENITYKNSVVLFWRY